ncbi:MAG: hypothetical protein WD992_00840 [Candidatus Levyibacteriota bacterium]
MEGSQDTPKSSNPFKRMFERFRRRQELPKDFQIEYTRPRRITPIAQNEQWDRMAERKLATQSTASFPENVTPFPQPEPPKGA